MSQSENLRLADYLREPRKFSTLVIHAFSQTALGKRGSPPANNRNRNSEYLPQRRQGRKGRRKHVKIFRKNICLVPPNLASLRLCGRHIRIRESSITGKFTQAARYDKHVGFSFRIVIRSTQSSEYFLIQKLFSPRSLALWNTGLQFHRASLRGAISESLHRNSVGQVPHTEA